MNKKKLTFLPLNLLLSLPIFCISIIVLTFVFNISIMPTIIVATAELIIDALNRSETDYLQSQ